MRNMRRASFPRSDGSGAYGGGTYDIFRTTGKSLGYPTLLLNLAISLNYSLFALGLTDPAVQAGQAFPGAAPTTNQVDLLINKQTFS